MSDKKDTPVSGTKEWSASSANVMLGCTHDCRYCYARSAAIRFGKITPDQWNSEQVTATAAKKVGKRSGTIMFPTTHDITPSNLEHTGEFLERLLVAGNKVLVVSKPHLSVMGELCRRFVPYRDQILFRFSIGSRNADVLNLWEPGAPSYAERLASLVHCFEQGFDTSVSMEPILDYAEDDIVAMYREMAPFVTDAIWLGKMNKAGERLARNGFSTDTALMEAATLLVASQSDDRIRALYARLQAEPKAKWKESIKKVVGLEIPTEAGLDV
jgi:DNA repair photolyase